MPELILSNFAMHIDLSPEEKMKIVSRLQHRKIGTRNFLLRQGEIDRNIYFVNRGCLRMFYTDHNGAEHNICFYPENWWACDNVSFFKETPAVNNIQALEETEVYSLSLSNLELLFTEVPKL